MKTSLLPSVALLWLFQCALAKDYFFDASAGNNGNGEWRSPFNRLAVIPTLDLRPGDSVLLKRGTTFSEVLELGKSGSDAAPIIIGAYGDGREPLPLVQASGHGLSSVLLRGASHVILQDLEITNRGDNTTARRGVYLYAEDVGQVNRVVLRRLFIHDVQGYMPSTTGGKDISVGKYANASGGIVIEAAGNSVPTYFKDLVIEDNVIHSVARQGIYTWSNWCQRDHLARFWYTLCFQPWAASTGFKVRRNTLSNIGGDGIVITGNDGAETSQNRVTGFNVNSGGNNAGIWTANSDNSHFHHNVVSGGTTTHDGMAYDVDHSTSGTVYEYNVSHDNEGGFFLLCPYDKPTQNFTIRYNLSVNDRTRLFQICPGNLVGGAIYKNTIYVGPGYSPYLITAPKNLNLDVLFADNIVSNEGSGAVTWDLDSPQFNATDNLLHNVGAWPLEKHTDRAPPRFLAAGATAPGAYRLLRGSPAYESAIDIEGDAAIDFFSNPSGLHKSKGFYSGPSL